MKLSVIIPCLNAADTIAVQLEALASQCWPEPWEVIVSDNGSEDESQAIVKRYMESFPDLHIVDASARRGSAYALNIGARTALGDSLAFCDADDEVGTGWVAAMGEALSRYDFVAGRFDTEKHNDPWAQKSRRNPQLNGIQRYNYPDYLPHAGGGSLGVKRSIFEAVGGFDESLRALQDTDFCWKIQLAGTELRFVPDAIVHIRYRDTLGGVYCQARQYGKYNVILYKRYHKLGMPKLFLKTGVRHWIKLLKRLPQLRDRDKRGGIVWNLGWRLGRLQACIRHRVVAL
ncbi:MAG: glycosyltransferase [Desulfobacteraceae bacterium]|nr:glycosyltransferase [Desulfobacteraceae bacterium]